MLSTTLAKTETVSVADTPVLSTTSAQTETVSVADTPVVSTQKIILDTPTISDTVSISLVSGALPGLNTGPLNTFNLNG